MNPQAEAGWSVEEASPQHLFSIPIHRIVAPPVSLLLLGRQPMLRASWELLRHPERGFTGVQTRVLNLTFQHLSHRRRLDRCHPLLDV